MLKFPFNYNEMYISEEDLNKVADAFEIKVQEAIKDLNVIGTVEYSIDKDYMINFTWKCPVVTSSYTISISKTMFLKLCNPARAMQEAFKSAALHIYIDLRSTYLNNLEYDYDFCHHCHQR